MNVLNRSALIWLVLLPLLAPSDVCRAQFICTVTNHTTTITGYNGTGGFVAIPETYAGYPVIAIESNAFARIDNILGVSIPESVTTIGDQAFLYCYGLTNAAISNGVGNIGLQTFYGCTALTSVAIPGSVTNIGQQAFAGCTEVTNVNLAEGVANVGSGAFSGFVRATTLTLPKSLANIQSGAFSQWASLSNLTIPNTVTNIGAAAFELCTNLTSVTIPASVRTIGDNAFSHCTSMTNVSLAAGLTGIGDWAFQLCLNLNNLVIPPTVTNIQYQAFASCVGLTNVYLSGSPPAGFDSTTFDYDTNVIFHYLPGNPGWGTTFLGQPTALWELPTPTILNNPATFGAQQYGFTFVISWATNVPVVVEACADLANPDWQPLQTNTLVNGAAGFTDFQWANYPARFYRVIAH